MKKFTEALILSIGLTLCGCSDTSQTETSIVEEENTFEIGVPNIQTEQAPEIDTVENSSEIGRAHV